MIIYRGTNKTDRQTHTHITSIFRDKLSLQGARVDTVEDLVSKAMKSTTKQH
jgi:hypothetical protein